MANFPKSLANDVNTKKVLEYRDTINVKAEQLVLKQIPETILKLNEIVNTAEYQSNDFTTIRQELNVPVPDPIPVNSHSEAPPAKRPRNDNSNSSISSTSVSGTRVLALPSGMVHSNKKLVEFIEFVKPFITKLEEDCSLLKMWITLLIPKIEDGNNFGVSIQEDTLAEIQSGETECAAYLERIATYYISRAKLVSKVAKYPHIEDYRRGVQEYDEMQYRNVRLCLIDMRNRYCIMHDIIVKNLEKIRKPRPTNAAESLY